MAKVDRIQDWTKLLQDKEGTKAIALDKNYAKHMIKPCKMIIILGKTGAGKSTALLEFLSRKQEFVEIIIFHFMFLNKFTIFNF